MYSGVVLDTFACVHVYLIDIQFVLLSPPIDVSSIDHIVSRRLSANDFKVEKVIGRGAFGEVQLVSLIHSVTV